MIEGITSSRYLIMSCEVEGQRVQQNFYGLISDGMSEAGDCKQRSSTKIFNESFFIYCRRHKDNFQAWVSHKEFFQLEQQEITIH